MIGGVLLFQLCLSWLIEWKVDVGSSGDRLLVKGWFIDEESDQLAASTFEKVKGFEIQVPWAALLTSCYLREIPKLPVSKPKCMGPARVTIPRVINNFREGACR
jgi:hypothetical protein